MKKLLLVVLLAVSLKASANSMLVDRISCGAFSSSDASRQNQYLWWVWGYLSASNQASTVDFLLQTDAAGVQGAIEKYCRENPIDYFLNAVISVRRQLFDRVKK